MNGHGPGTDVIDAPAIAALLPHGAGLSLLDAVIAWDERTLRATSRRHLRAAHPLRAAQARGEQAQNAPDEVSAVQLIEYAAQAAAVHIGLLAPRRQAIRGGVLALVRDVQLHAVTIARVDADLHIDVARRGGLPAGFLYEFVATVAGATVAAGKLGIVLRAAAR